MQQQMPYLGDRRAAFRAVQPDGSPLIISEFTAHDFELPVWEFELRTSGRSQRALYSSLPPVRSWGKAEFDQQPRPARSVGKWHIDCTSQQITPLPPDKGRASSGLVGLSSTSARSWRSRLIISSGVTQLYQAVASPPRRHLGVCFGVCHEAKEIAHAAI